MIDIAKRYHYATLVHLKYFKIDIYEEHMHFTYLYQTVTTV